MTDENNQLVVPRQDVQPSDIIAGLGLADRALLAACLALFEDSTLSKRLEQLYSKSSDWVRKHLGKAGCRCLAEVDGRCQRARGDCERGNTKGRLEE